MPWKGLLASPEGFFRNYIMDRTSRLPVPAGAAVTSFKAHSPDVVMSDRVLTDIFATVTTKTEIPILSDAETIPPRLLSDDRRP